MFVGNPIGLIRALVEKGQGFDEAIEIAKKGIADSDWNVRSESIGLITTYVEKGQGFDAAIEIAKKGIADSDLHIRYASIG